MRPRVLVGLGAALVALLLVTDVAAQRRGAHRRPVPAREGQPRAAPAPTYRSAVLMDAETGQVLVSHEPDLPLPPASLTKIMTMLLVMEAVARGEAKLTDVVRVSRRASHMGGSQVFLREGEEVTLEELMKTIAIASANDATVAVAEHVAGSQEEFVARMNERAKELGLTATRFVNTNGLPPPRGESGDVSSALDVAKMSRALVEHARLLTWTATPEDRFRDGAFILTNTNRLVGTVSGLDGLKTGFLGESGFHVAATARRGEFRLIAVVLGGRTSRERFQAAEKLLATGFATWTRMKVLARGAPLNESVAVRAGAARRVDLVVGQDVRVLVRREDVKQVTRTVSRPEKVEAPVKAGQPLGEVQVRLRDAVLVAAPAVAAADVARLPLLRRIFWFL